MVRKLAVKRLTASDLTFFEWHFRNHNAGNQKAINLNADVFIERLYPALPELAIDSSGKVPIDLSVFGPNGKGRQNLQRKIVKFGTYKNWRLNGEFIYNPAEDPERYNVLAPGDFAVMEFSGAALPTSLVLVLVSAAAHEDRVLHAGIDAFLGNGKMTSLSPADLNRITMDADLSSDHPVRRLTLDSDLEDVALGGSQGRQRLYATSAARQISKDDLSKSRKISDETGRIGEELVNAHLRVLCSRGDLKSVEWTAQSNAVAPYDFKIVTPMGKTVVIDVKSTAGEFERPLHFSFNEILQVANGAERYEVYRVFEVSPTGAKLRICSNARPMGIAVFSALSSLPDGVTADSVSVSVRLLAFGGEVPLEIGNEDEAACDTE